jgi:hypothetical protein
VLATVPIKASRQCCRCASTRRIAWSIRFNAAEHCLGNTSCRMCWLLAACSPAATPASTHSAGNGCTSFKCCPIPIVAALWLPTAHHHQWFGSSTQLPALLRLVPVVMAARASIQLPPPLLHVPAGVLGSSSRRTVHAQAIAAARVPEAMAEDIITLKEQLHSSSDDHVRPRHLWPPAAAGLSALGRHLRVLTIMVAGECRMSLRWLVCRLPQCCDGCIGLVPGMPHHWARPRVHVRSPPRLHHPLESAV